MFDSMNVIIILLAFEVSPVFSLRKDVSVNVTEQDIRIYIEH
ncbi:MAG: hypothetical protein QW364_02425 [Thermoplasmatales archaeon]